MTVNLETTDAIGGTGKLKKVKMIRLRDTKRHTCHIGEIFF